MKKRNFCQFEGKFEKKLKISQAKCETEQAQNLAEAHVDVVGVLVGGVPEELVEEGGGGGRGQAAGLELLADLHDEPGPDVEVLGGRLVEVVDLDLDDRVALLGDRHDVVGWRVCPEVCRGRRRRECRGGLGEVTRHTDPFASTKYA